MQIGKLRHRIAIQSRVETQDATSGAVTLTWANYATDVPAEVVPLSGREFMAASAEQAGVEARIMVRYDAGILPTMRVTFDGLSYDIRAVLPDPTARRHLALMVSRGVTDGD